MGRLHTCYSPVRRSPPGIATRDAPRLACVKPAASVHPEPGSNSSLYLIFLYKISNLSIPTLSFIHCFDGIVFCLLYCTLYLFPFVSKELFFPVLFGIFVPKRERKSTAYFHICKFFPAFFFIFFRRREINDCLSCSYKCKIFFIFFVPRAVFCASSQVFFQKFPVFGGKLKRIFEGKRRVFGFAFAKSGGTGRKNEVFGNVRLKTEQ